jgi:hypothetical protein
MKQIKKLRGDLRSLKKQFKPARAAEKPPLEELLAILRRKLKDIRRAEGHRRRHKERARETSLILQESIRFFQKIAQGQEK